jgi:hypothetical protein
MRRDCAFFCHKATIAGREIACRGHFDATGGGQLARIAGRLGVIEFIDPKTLRATADSASGFSPSAVTDESNSIKCQE